jgi:prepilin-type N-terminal cleavage/methylation domain-containing protein
VRRRPGGFTLIETIVTVGLLAVLAAFVVPTVIQKSGAGDPVKVANDLNSLRTGLDNFSNDTKAGFPNQVWQLTAKPSTSNVLVDGVTNLSAGQVALWQGPYINATIGSASADSMPTGYTAYVRNLLQRYDAEDNKGEVSGGPAAATFSATKTLFVAVRINGLNTAQAATVNKMIDGPDDVNEADGSNITGRFRFDKPNAAGVVVAYFLASPIV